MTETEVKLMELQREQNRKLLALLKERITELLECSILGISDAKDIVKFLETRGK